MRHRALIDRLGLPALALALMVGTAAPVAAQEADAPAQHSPIASFVSNVKPVKIEAPTPIEPSPIEATPIGEPTPSGTAEAAVVATPAAATPAAVTQPAAAPATPDTPAPSREAAAPAEPPKAAPVIPVSATSIAPVAAAAVIVSPAPPVRLNPPQAGRVTSSPEKTNQADGAGAAAPAPLPVLPKPAVHSVKFESPSQTAAPQPVTRALSLDVNKSRVIRLSRPARDVLVANPAIADIVLRSPDTAFVVGRRIGETNVFFFDAEGHQIDGVDLTVKFDSAAVTAVLRQMIPDEQIDISTANQSIVLTGSVASAQEADNARQIARQFVADDNGIINMLRIRDKSQVLLRVRISEMSRQIVKELGITPGQPTPFNFSIGGSHFSLTGNAPSFSNTPFAALSGAIPLAGGGSATLTTLLQALESNGLVKTLAEPNLTAISGETASFLVGGQFPVPSPQPSAAPGAASTVTVVYKDFGVRLTFTPVVLSSGQINLKIATEVSQLSTNGQITITGFTIPALTVRRATTTVELPSGGSIAIAGLLQNDIQNTINGFPLLKDIPILGALFSSTQFQRNESDLVIAVTPLLVKPVDANAMALPTDGFGPASDFNMYFMSRLNATYTKPTPDHPLGQPKGPYGFILE